MTKHFLNFQTGVFEWRWNQKYNCGHVRPATTFMQVDARQARRNLAKQPCPKCVLNALLAD